MIPITRSLIGVAVPLILMVCLTAGAGAGETERLLAEGRKLLESGHTDKALAIYLKCLKMDDTNIAALSGAGKAYYAKAEYAKAAKCFKEMVERDPSNVKFKLYLGRASLQLGQADQARKAFLDALDLNPKSVTALIGLGEVELMLKNTFTANDYFKRAQALDPNNKALEETIERLKVRNQEELRGGDSKMGERDRRAVDQAAASRQQPAPVSSGAHRRGVDPRKLLPLFDGDGPPAGSGTNPYVPRPNQ